jgi:pilus assembly protein TadC
MLVQGNDFAMRILSPGQLALLLLVFAGFHIFNALSIYFRAFKKEPLAVPNLLTTVAIFIGSCLMAQNYGVTGVIGIMASAYLILSIYVIMGFLRTNPNIS